MNLSDIKSNLDKLNASYALGDPCPDNQLSKCEKALGVTLPEQVKLFYRSMDGLSVDSPALEIIPLEKLNKNQNGMIHFATINNENYIAFDTNSMNEADQWNIVNQDTGYLVTLTMASFWANKIWAWLKSLRTIWKDEIHI